MAKRRYSDEFKLEAVKQVLENGYSIHKRVARPMSTAKLYGART